MIATMINNIKKINKDENSLLDQGLERFLHAPFSTGPWPWALSLVC